MKKKLLFLSIVAGLTVVCALCFEEVAQTFITTPALYVLWVLDLASRTVSQTILWVIFVALATIILARSVIKSGQSKPKRSARAHREVGRVEELAQMLALAQKWKYSQWRLAHSMAELAAEIIAFRGQFTPEQIQEQFRDGTVETNPAMRAYFQAALTNLNTRQPGVLSNVIRQFRAQEPPSPLDLDSEQVVRFLEEKLNS